MQFKRIIVIVKVLVYNIFSIILGGEEMTFKNEYVGLSIKEILLNKLSFSKRAITYLKSRPDGILLNGEHATVRAIIKEGDTLTINHLDDNVVNTKLIPSNTIPDIIYEDDYIIALNKPPFMPTHQSQGHFYDTLANSIAYYYSSKGQPFVFRSVNRLDRNTSGIVLVARDRHTSHNLSTQMKRDCIKKSYIAILVGSLPNDEGLIKTHIRRKEKSIILREVCSEQEDSKIAITKYKVLAKNEGMTLVEAMPITGRTHQLRVHFAHMGAPILGDDLYGLASNLINRHALHAYTLSFINPSTNEPMCLFAPLLDDMKNVIENTFGKDYLNHGRK